MTRAQTNPRWQQRPGAESVVYDCLVGACDRNLVISMGLQNCMLINVQNLVVGMTEF